GREKLEAEGIPTRVVSMPCWEFFEKQPQAYRDEGLPSSVAARVSIHGRGPAFLRGRPALDRGGRDAGLAEMGGRPGRLDRPGPVRRVRAGRGRDEKAGLHGRARRGARQGVADVKLGVGCDHAGFPLKQEVIDLAARLGHTVEDFGTFSTEAADYPIYARK